MKDTKLKKQYNKVSDIYADVYYQQNQQSRNAFYKILGKNLKGKKLLDLACGDGLDIHNYSKLGADIHGIDMSEEFIAKAQVNNPKFAENMKVADFEGTKLPKSSFDIVTCKYAAQTSKRIDKIFDEAHRLLRPHGEFIILVTHPLRQYVERLGNKKNYFRQKIVNSVIFDGAMTVREPTHTFFEYFSPEILRKFDLHHFDEGHDTAAEQIGNDVYPGFMVMKFKKR